jgi:DtxR family Mn-dependent transcriptional regulator
MNSVNRKQRKEEHIERLYNMNEVQDDSVDALETAMNERYEADIIEELSSEDMATLTADGRKIGLTQKGLDYGRHIIRAHRLAERLLYDALGGDIESGACEFEHIVTTELVDSICILLGHPRLCPHGMPIPEGQCCKDASRTAQSSVTSLAELKVGQSAKVAYINSKSDPQLHKLDNLCIRPGVVVTLHQRYPAYVVECEGSNIAMDDKIVANIHVWQKPDPGKVARTE